MLRHGVALGMVLGAMAVHAADWPAFRGSSGDGRSSETGVIPDTGPISLRPRWRRPLGSAYSGIAVAGDRLFTLYSDGTDDHLVALQCDDGTTLWRLRLGPAHPGRDGSHEGPLSTPAVAGGMVVALGAHGELVAAEADTGAELWRVHLVDDLGARQPHYGFAASPRQSGQTVVLPVGGYEHAVVGLDRSSGAVRWWAGTDAVAYQSPVLVTTDGDEQVLVAGSSRVFRLDPADGTVRWQYEHGGGGTRGAESLSPVPAAAGELLLTHRDDAAQLICADAATGTARTLWQNRSIRNSYALPVFHEDSFYAYSARSLVCVDAATGEQRWRSRAPGDGFAILVDGHLVIQTKDGGLFLVRAQPDGYHERAALDLFSDTSWTSPSFADKAVFARSFSEIACVDLVVGTEPVQERPDTPAPQLSPLLERLSQELRSAPDPGAVVDRFLASQPVVPIAEGNLVTFVFRGEAGDVALAGDLVGARREWPMQRLPGTDLYARSVEVEPDAVFSYLFVVDFEPVTDPLNPSTVRSRVWGPELEPVASGDLLMSWFAMPGWRRPSHLRPPAALRGRMEHHVLSSAVLGAEVPLAVYLPAGFDEGHGPYPVVFVLDGRDAIERGAMLATLDNLIGTTVQPVLAVFVLDQGHGSPRSFSAMIAGELIPFVDSAYPTIADPAGRAVAGSGWESLTAAYCAFKRPGTVGKLAMQSVYALTAPPGFPEHWVGDATAEPVRVFLEWGTHDLRNSHEAWSMAEDARRLFAIIEERGYHPAGGEVHQGSGWACWRTRAHAWLEALFPLADRK